MTNMQLGILYYKNKVEIPEIKYSTMKEEG